MGEPNITAYGGLASAIASRPLAVEWAADGQTWTDGHTVYIDPALSASDIAHAVVVQSALLAGGALRKDIMVTLSRRRDKVVQRYLALELGRVADALAQRIPARTASRLLPEYGTSSGPETSLVRALSRESIPAPPDWAGVLKPGRLRRTDEEELRASPSDDNLDRLGELREQERQPDEPPEDLEDDSKIVKLLSAPGMSNPIGEAIQKLLGMGRSAPDDTPGMEQMPAGRQRMGRVGRNARRGRVSQTVSAMFESKQAAGLRYPEWDSVRGRYRPDWCTVVEYDPAEIEGSELAGQAGMERQLARVGVELERHRREPDGDSLDMTALVEYAVERRRGEPDPNIYENRRRTLRDLSVLILLDCSGSTADETSGHVVFEEERQLAGDLTASLERLGDRVGTFGFYSQGRDLVKFLRVKDFGERFDTTARRRLGSVRPTGFTRMGAAVRHGAMVLESQAPATNMLLVVIGDGLPYDDGYEDRYARADVRQAIGETVQRGIGIMGVGIRSSTPPEVLEDVWAGASFRVVGESRDVAGHLRLMMLSALSSTRGNGRRRELTSAGQQHQLRAVGAGRRSRLNSYV